jgi:hypothetical protein
MCHLYGSYLSKELERSHSHFVIVVKNHLNPKSHLVGTLNSRFISQFSSVIFTIIHFLFQSSAITAHSLQDGTIIPTFSIGSIFV